MKSAKRPIVTQVVFLSLLNLNLAVDGYDPHGPLITCGEGFAVRGQKIFADERKLSTNFTNLHELG